MGRGKPASAGDATIPSGITMLFSRASHVAKHVRSGCGGFAAHHLGRLPRQGMRGKQPRVSVTKHSSAAAPAPACPCEPTCMIGQRACPPTTQLRTHQPAWVQFAKVPFVHDLTIGEVCTASNSNQYLWCIAKHAKRPTTNGMRLACHLNPPCGVDLRRSEGSHGRS